MRKRQRRRHLRRTRMRRPAHPHSRTRQPKPISSRALRCQPSPSRLQSASPTQVSRPVLLPVSQLRLRLRAPVWISSFRTLEIRPLPVLQAAAVPIPLQVQAATTHQAPTRTLYRQGLGGNCQSRNGSKATRNVKARILRWPGSTSRAAISMPPT